jgi:hypothetical protein
MTWIQYFNTLTAVLVVGCLIGLAVAVLLMR